MHDGTKQMIALAIDQVNFNGGTIVVLNGNDKFRVSLKGNETIIEKVS